MIRQPKTYSYFIVRPVGDLFSLTLQNDEPEFNQTLAFLTDQDAADLAMNILAELKLKRGE